MEEKIWKVYKHINKINNKLYIGITSNIEKRFGKNGSGYLRKNKNGDFTQPHFANAIQKYGWENFEHIILYDCLTKNEANKIEKDLINKYKSNNPLFGYNIRAGGTNGLLSKETKEKISKSRKGKCIGKDNPFFGKHHTQEVKDFLSKNTTKSNKKRNLSGENNPMYNYKYTEAQLKKKSLLMKGRFVSEETKQKISEANKKYYQIHEHHCTGTKRTEEFKKHMSEVMSNIKKDDKWRENIGKSHSPYFYKCIETNMVYYSSGEASRCTGIDKTSIQNVTNGKQKTAGGFHWIKYLKKQEVLK